MRKARDVTALMFNVRILKAVRQCTTCPPMVRDVERRAHGIILGNFRQEPMFQKRCPDCLYACFLVRMNRRSGYQVFPKVNGTTYRSSHHREHIVNSIKRRALWSKITLVPHSPRSDQSTASLPTIRKTFDLTDKAGHTQPHVFYRR